MWLAVRRTDLSTCFAVYQSWPTALTVLLHAAVGSAKPRPGSRERVRQSPLPSTIKVRVSFDTLPTYLHPLSLFWGVVIECFMIANCVSALKDEMWDFLKIFLKNCLIH